MQCANSICSGRKEGAGSVSEIFTYEDNFDSVFEAASSCNNSLAAYGVISKAFSAFSGKRTWRIPVQADAVRSRRRAAYTFQRTVYVGCDFVHACNDNYIFRTVNQ